LERKGNAWSLKKILPIIQEQDMFTFKFVVDGTKWELSPKLPTVQDSSGNKNHFIEIPHGHKPI